MGRENWISDKHNKYGSLQWEKNNNLLWIALTEIFIEKSVRADWMRQSGTKQSKMNRKIQVDHIVKMKEL